MATRTDRKSKTPKKLSWTTAAYQIGKAGSFLKQTDFISNIEQITCEIADSQANTPRLLTVSKSLKYREVGLVLEALAKAKTPLKKKLTKADNVFFTRLKELLEKAFQSGLKIQSELGDAESAVWLQGSLGYLERILDEDRKSLVLFSPGYLALKSFVEELETAPSPGEALAKVDDLVLWRFIAEVDEAIGTKNRKLAGEIDDLRIRISRLLEASMPLGSENQDVIEELLRKCLDVRLQVNMHQGPVGPLDVKAPFDPDRAELALVDPDFLQELNEWATNASGNIKSSSSFVAHLVAAGTAALLSRPQDTETHCLAARKLAPLDITWRLIQLAWAMTDDLDRMLSVSWDQARREVTLSQKAQELDRQHSRILRTLEGHVTKQVQKIASDLALECFEHLPNDGRSLARVGVDNETGAFELAYQMPDGEVLADLHQAPTEKPLWRIVSDEEALAVLMAEGHPRPMSVRLYAMLFQAHQAWKFGYRKPLKTVAKLCLTLQPDFEAAKAILQRSS